MNSTNIITGKSGFLLTELLPHLKLHNCIIHFGGPSQLSEFTKDSTDHMIGHVKNLLKVQDKDFIFASSMGVLERSDNPYQQMYNDAKKKCEDLIIDSGKKYSILRIPRVYGKTRTKGLFKHIKNNNIDDWNKSLQYIDIDEFVKQTVEKLNAKLNAKFNINNDIIYYETISGTILEIKEKYIKD